MMGWLTASIERGMKRGVDRALAEALPPMVSQAVDQHLTSDRFRGLVLQIAMENPRFAFIKWMQAHYLKKATGLSERAAFIAARDWLNMFLEGERAEFGDARYDWSRDGAITLADEDLQYWETAP